MSRPTTVHSVCIMLYITCIYCACLFHRNVFASVVTGQMASEFAITALAVVFGTHDLEHLGDLGILAFLADFSSYATPTSGAG